MDQLLWYFVWRCVDSSGGWTIKYTESTRMDNPKKHEREMTEEFNGINVEIKNNLSVQYKPILTVCLIQII